MTFDLCIALLPSMLCYHPTVLMLCGSPLNPSEKGSSPQDTVTETSLKFGLMLEGYSAS